MPGVSMNVNFKYDIGDEVKIKVIDLKGYVTSLRHDSQDDSYLVVWWISGERNCEWLAEWELE